MAIARLTADEEARARQNLSVVWNEIGYDVLAVNDWNRGEHADALLDRAFDRDGMPAAWERLDYASKHSLAKSVV